MCSGRLLTTDIGVPGWMLYPNFVAMMTRLRSSRITSWTSDSLSVRFDVRLELCQIEHAVPEVDHLGRVVGYRPGVGATDRAEPDVGLGEVVGRGPQERQRVVAHRLGKLDVGETFVEQAQQPQATPGEDLLRGLRGDVHDALDAVAVAPHR